MPSPSHSVPSSRPAPPSARDPWVGVELRHLAALGAVAETGSFHGAARRLGYVQSAVSQQIACLERIVGTRLVDRSRGPRPVSLTGAGEVLLRHADEILARLRIARVDLAGYDDPLGARLTVGVVSGAHNMLVGAALEQFHVRRGGVQVVVREALDEGGICDMIDSGEIDTALVTLPLRRASVEVARVAATPFVAVVKPGSPLTTLRRLPTVAELNRARVLVPVGSIAAEALAEAGVTVSPGHRRLSVSTALSLVDAGLGVAIQPRVAVTDSPNRVIVELGELLERRHIGMAWLRGRQTDGLLQTFLRCCRRAADRLGVADSGLMRR